MRAHAFVYVLLAAFVAQSAVTASHFHAGGQADGASFGVASLTAEFDSQGGLDKNSKHKGDVAAKCPACQAASMAGSFIGASHSVLDPPLHSFYVLHDERIVAVERSTAAWRSRAPPAL